MKMICLLIFLTLIHTSAIAQDDSRYARRDGRGGLLFVFDEMRLGSFGGGIGGKYWLSDMWAMNASAHLRQDRRNETRRGGGTRASQVTTTGFSAALERHLLRARFSPYVGLRVGYTYWRVKNTNAIESYSSETRSDRHSPSIAVSLGAEFWLSRSFSVAGQYSFSANYSKQTSSDISTSSDSYERSTDYWTSALYAGSLVLAVYF